MVLKSSSDMSRCAWCGSHCSAHSDSMSHGICTSCYAKEDPDSEASKRYKEAMYRGLKKIVSAGMTNLAELIINGDYQKTHI